jgi:hypothetical protein
MADTDGFTYKHAGLEGSLKTKLIIEELNSSSEVVKKWEIGTFSTAQQALAARQIIADSLGKRELGPALSDMQIEGYKASL